MREDWDVVRKSSFASSFTEVSDDKEASEDKFAQIGELGIRRNNSRKIGPLGRGDTGSALCNDSDACEVKRKNKAELFKSALPNGNSITRAKFFGAR